MADLSHSLRGHTIAQSILAGFGAAHQLRRANPEGIRSRLGRRGVEDDRGACVERLESVWSVAFRRPENAGDQQCGADFGPAAEVNLREIAEVKRAWPDRAVVVSAMVESHPQAWADIVRRIEDTGADGIELNYGCPHGMSERGMGSAVGQVPEYCERITRWVMDVARIPVIVKLTPNITNVVEPARAAVTAGANALSLINTINSIVGVDLETLEITPSVGGKGGHGGYAGPAVKPIALNMLSALGTDPVLSKAGLPISGMGGISTWKDAAEFLLLGASSLQVCTAVMHYGYRIIEDLCDGLSNWMDEKGFASVAEVSGRSLHRISAFKDLDLSYRAVARIDEAKCIKCNLCYVACNDTAHQCIDLMNNRGEVVPARSYDVRSNGKTRR